MILPSAVRDDLVAHARQTAPAECCGLLIGTQRAIAAAVRASNVSPDPARFVIDPGDHIRARRDARDRGLQVVGFYHSHPHSPARPSATDLAEASYTDHVYLIVGLAEAPPDVRLYRFTGEQLEPIELVDE